ncbi:hypothetical protein M011DRAFT_479061 [Sporormia fimetaria CBS 119925]|uniref:Tafazzin n=1 Tax=Sporormia fimetaria CBS 119925 TaxID=1340428 RepID=A0A6A6V790_9PLEO|nr:hypothetical protein M011DRAFT_479061 [Sporormia fimetaria CBS 119925]
MPKKRTPHYTHTKSSYIHPSLQRTPPSTNPSSDAQSVNTRLQQLRLEQAPKASSSARNSLIEAVTSSSIPQHLRQILQIPELEAPKPKGGRPVRRRGRIGEPRLPPGPAPPSSWVKERRRRVDFSRIGENDGPMKGVGGFGEMVKGYLCDKAPQPRSLLDLCLKTFARDFIDLVEFEQYYLSALPTRLKEVLLSYVAVYAPSAVVDAATLGILFAGDEEHGSDAKDIRFLDLSGQMSPRYTFADLKRALPHSTTPKPSKPPPLPTNASSLSPTTSNHAPSTPIPENWDDEADTIPALAPPSPTPFPHTPIFTILTHLSLSHPALRNPWPGLLSLAPSLNKLTHLSLSHWPIPTSQYLSAPSSSSTSSTPEHAEIDWTPTATLLHRLSKQTYSLTHLDLEGCAWIPALTYRAPSGIRRAEGSDDASGWGPGAAGGGNHTSSSVAPDFGAHGAWSQLRWLNLYQGFMPGAVVGDVGDSAEIVMLKKKVGEWVAGVRKRGMDDEVRSVYDLEMCQWWFEREVRVREVVEEIRKAGTVVRPAGSGGVGEVRRISCGWCESYGSVWRSVGV